MQKVFLHLSKILNSDTESEDPLSIITIVAIFQFIQQLGIMLPEQNTLQITYDQYSYTIKLVCQLAILEIDTPLITIFLVAFNFGILCLFLVQNLGSIQKFILEYWLALPYILFIPQHIHFCMMIKNHDGVYLGIALFGIVMIILQSVISLYFIRNMLFLNKIFYRDQTIYNYIVFIHKIALGVLYVFHEDYLIYIITLVCQILLSIFETMDIYLKHPYNIYENQLTFSILFTRFCWMGLFGYIITTSSQKIFNQSQFILFTILGLMFFRIGYQIYFNILLLKMESFKSKDANYTLMVYQLKLVRFLFTKKSKNMKYKFLIRLYFKYHESVCKKGCYQYYQANQKKFLRKLQLDLIQYQDQTLDNENIFIFHLFLYKNEWEAPLLSFIKLKQRLINQHKNRSLYFRVKTIMIEKKLITLIDMSHLQAQSSKSNRQLTVGMIVDLFHQEFVIIGEIQKVIQQKAKILNQILLSKVSWDQLLDKLMKLGEQIYNLQLLITKQYHIDIVTLSLDKIGYVLQLKILCLYYSYVMNDYFRASNCQQLINHKLLNDRLISNGKLTNLAMINKRVLSLQVSVVKQMGQILNQNKKPLGKLLGMEYDRFNEIQNIKEVMPKFISRIHDSFIEQFLETAHSNFFTDFRPVYILTQNQYVRSINIQFMNSFKFFDDFVIEVVIQHQENDEDTILFDSQGKILGFGKDIFEQMIEPFNKNITKQYILDFGFIYTFIVEIFDIMERFQKSFSSSYFGECLFITRQSVIDCSQSYDHFQFSDSMDGSNQGKEQINLLLCQTFQANIKQQIKSKNLITSEKFTIKFELSQHELKYNQQCFKYYVFNVLDYRRIWNDDPDELVQLNWVSGLFESRRFSENSSTQNNKFRKSKDSEDNIIDDFEDNTPKQNIPLQISPRLEITTENGDFLKQLQNERIHFIQPQVNTTPQEPILFESEHSVNGSLQKRFQSVGISRQISKINSKHIQQSQQSSNKSLEGSLYLNFKNFLEQNYFSQNIKTIIYLDFLFILTILIGGIVISLLIVENKNLMIENSHQVTAPLRCNRFFTKSASLSWILVLQALNKTQNSEYQIKQTITELQNLKDVIPANMTNIMDIFQQMSGAGLLIPEQNTTIDLLYLKNVSTNFIKFITILQLQTINLYQIKIDDYQNLESTLDTDYLYSLLMVRYNYKNFYYINEQLLDALFSSFQIELDLFNQRLVIILISCLGFLFLLSIIQLIFWNQYHSEILILGSILGQVQIVDAMKEINKLNIQDAILEEDKTGIQDWQTFNFDIFLQNENGSDKSEGKDQQLQRRNLYTKLHSKQGGRYKKLLMALICIIINSMYYVGGYLIQNSQQSTIVQMQALQTNFVQFSSQIDILIASMLIIKTQPLIYAGFLEKEIYTNETIQSFRDNRKIFHLFFTLSDQFSQRLSSVFKDMMVNDIIQPKYRDVYVLYNGNICLILKPYMNFCNLQDLGQEVFIEKYGNYNVGDDNSEYLSLGIIGMVSRIQSICNEYYHYEYETTEYIYDQEQLKEFVDTPEFNAVIFSHYRDTFMVIVQFLNLLLANLESVAITQKYIIVLYISVLGIILLIGQTAFYIHQTAQGRRILLQIKLSLSILPEFYIYSASTQSIVKQFIQ